MPTRVSTRVAAGLALALLVALAGCGGSAGGGSDGGDLVRQSGGSEGATVVADTGAAPKATGDAGSGGGGAGSSGGESELQVQQQAIIRTGQVSIEVESYDRARENLTRATGEYGGFLSDSREVNHRVGNETYTSGRLVLRVPQENFTALLDRIKSEGTVEDVSTSSQDVTDQLVDIEARLGNLRAERDRLRELYRQANETEDVLAVERRLSEVQTEIERLEARQQSLERRVAYSTITVEMREPRPTSTVGPVSKWYDTPVLSAFLESVHGVVVVLRALVVAFAYALPYLLVFSLPLVAGILVWRFGLRDRVAE